MKSLALISLIGLLLCARTLEAEPMFLSKQYPRCTSCHYSETGGGMLTPYGRSLTKEELSTSKTGNPAFLWGAFGDAPDADAKGLQMAIDARPGHLNFWFPGGSADQNIIMNADVLAAYRVNSWTLYGEIGRIPETPGSKIDSYEYWANYQTANGFGIRFGRFLPAFGINFADHTGFGRAPLGLNTLDQVYGVEVSRSTEHTLWQATISPGRADSIIHDDGQRAFTAAGRYQFDLAPRTALVISGLYRNDATLVPKNGVTGAALGFAPTGRISIWTEADAQFAEGAGGTSWIVVNETAFEVFRGIWAKISPQLRTQPGVPSGGIFRTLFEADVYPQTHWNLGTSFYLDRDRTNDLVNKTLLLQVHVYL
jgi:hypothetical protein